MVEGIVTDVNNVDNPFIPNIDDPITAKEVIRVIPVRNVHV